MCIPAVAGGEPWVVASREEEKRAEIRDALERRSELPLGLTDALVRSAKRRLVCHEPMRLTAPEYEHIRENGATFGVLRGHSSNGSVVAEHEHYVVVRKPDGSGGEVARALDSRGEDA